MVEFLAIAVGGQFMMAFDLVVFTLTTRFELFECAKEIVCVEFRLVALRAVCPRGENCCLRIILSGSENRSVDPVGDNCVIVIL